MGDLTKSKLLISQAILQSGSICCEVGTDTARNRGKAVEDTFSSA